MASQDQSSTDKSDPVTAIENKEFGQLHERSKISLIKIKVFIF